MKDSINTGFNLRSSVEQTPALWRKRRLPAKCGGKTTVEPSLEDINIKEWLFFIQNSQPDWMKIAWIHIVYTTNWMNTVTWLNMDCCMATFRASEYVNSTSGSNNFSWLRFGSADCPNQSPKTTKKHDQPTLHGYSRKCEHIQGKNPCAVFMDIYFHVLQLEMLGEKATKFHQFNWNW